MASSHNFSLVILSIIISVFASFTALRLSQRGRMTRGIPRSCWLAASAVAMGGGIWAMHFVAMLALTLPVVITYDVSLTLISLLLAILFTAGGIFVTFRLGVGGANLILAGIFMGTGIATMHYSGMAAMRMSAAISYDPSLVALSVLIAIAASMTALWLTFRLGTLLSNTAGALVMGAAVCGMHYCGMSAAAFAHHTGPIAAEDTGVPAYWLAAGIAGITLIVLCLGLVMAIIDQHLSLRAAAEAERLKRSEARFRALVQNAADAIAVTDRTGEIIYESSSTKSVLGYDEDALLGCAVAEIVHPDDRHKLLAFFESVTRRDSETQSIDLQLRHANGNWGEYEILATNLLDNDSVNGIVVNIRDISARLQNVELEELILQRTRQLSLANGQLRAEIAERKNAEDALRQAHDQLEIKVQERTAELEAAKNIAIQADQAKSQFLAHMSHELRTPLNAIIGFSDALTHGIRGPLSPQQTEYIGHVLMAGRHLLTLINTVLDLSKIESGKMQLDYRDCDLDQFIDELTTAIRPVVEDNGNCLLIEHKSPLGSVQIDVLKLRQTLFNLLSNAAKFTKDGRITLSTARIEGFNGSRLRFVIHDTGIGIAEEDLPRLFENFHQANPSIASRFGGTGLGLALSRRLCHAMGGDIRADSVLGVGSSFIVDLPATP